MNTTTAKSLSAALILSLAVLSGARAAEAPRAEHIVDLPAVTVRASSEDVREAIVRGAAFTAQKVAGR